MTDAEYKQVMADDAALRAELEQVRDQYAQVAELVYGEAEYDHDGVMRRIGEVLEERDKLRETEMPH